MFFSHPIPLAFSIVAPKRENEDNIALNVQNRKIADLSSFLFFNEYSLRTPCSYMYFTSCLRIFFSKPCFNPFCHHV